MYFALRRILFALEAERAHDVALNALATVSRNKTLTALLARCHRHRGDLPVEVMGLKFPNPIGLAAGLDKHARACNAWHALGFGFIELGAVTPRPQPGNPRPRLHRLTNERALINRMGFNSVGLQQFCRNIARSDAGIIKGVNLGKNAATAIEKAATDYIACLEAVYDFADYATVNISSPNTRGLRELQDADALQPLLTALDRRRMQLADATGKRMPLALKISPDLSAGAIDAVANLARQHHIDAIAATNTTLSRPGVEAHAHVVAAGALQGGLSGAPLAAKSTATVARLYRNLQGEIPIIGVGGVDSGPRALEKLQAGADLVQIYTGLVYRGPRLIADIIDGLRAAAGDKTMRAFVDDLRAQHASYSTVTVPDS